MKKEEVEEHFDKIAPEYDSWKEKNSYYYNTLKFFISNMIPKGSSILDVGCGTGEILGFMEPSRGVGVDISEEMIKLAIKKFPDQEFIHSSIEDLDIDEKFDYIIMVDIMDHVYDVMDIFNSIYKFCKPTTKIYITTINPLWEPILEVAEKMKEKMPEGPHNFIDRRSLAKMLELINFSLSYSGYLLLLPKYIPGLSYLANSIGTRLWPFRGFSSCQYLTIHPKQENTTDLGYGCSVIIPCYNEEGNIEDAVRRVPHMGRETEIVVVNDGSSDGTADKVKELQKEFPNLRLVDYFPNRGKGSAVKAGFEAATQEVMMILDADISTPPEELPRFFDPLNKGICQFVNGTRLVYPMEDQAMRTLNYYGNKLFGWLMSFIVQQKLTDTLCGTKAFYKKDLPRIKWGKDKWGDFDLLFGAAKIGSKILEVPVHYKSRVSGESKMKSLRHGCHLLMACFRGFCELIFIPPKEYYSRLKRIEHEVAHGRVLRESWQGTLWYWETPAGRIRWNRRVSLLSDHIKPKMKVLELGCGVGYLTGSLAKKAKEVVAIDISPDLLAVAREKVSATNVSFKEENAYELKYKDGTFDTIIASSVLHHLEVEQALRESFRVLKSKGTIHLTEPNWFNPLVFLERKIPYLRERMHVSPDEGAFTRSGLKKKLMEFGFDEIEIYPFDFLHPGTPQWLIPFVKGFGNLLEKIPLIKEIAGSLCVKARKP